MTGHDKSEHWIARWISAGTHHLPAALVVTAIVSICHHHLHLLDAIDGYAYFGIGNLTANSIASEIRDEPTTHNIARKKGHKATVAVVLIDQKSNEAYYQERSPLNRCELKKDLEAIYNLPQPPKLLVVDLDLSPTYSDSPVESSESSEPHKAPENTAHEDCDKQLLTLLKQPHKATHTVLMAPFNMLDAEAQKKINEWKEQLEGTCFVSFAKDPNINVSYGLVNNIECNKDSMAATAYENHSRKSGSPVNCLQDETGHEPLRINPGQYFSGLQPVLLSQLPSRRIGSQYSNHPVEALSLPVMFVGTGFGDGDTFLTPLGTMYGVEVHAAAFMSLVEPTTHNDLSAFLLDLALGLGLGGLIAWSWRRYFSLRFSSSAFKRQAAPWMILILALGLLLLVAGLTFLSFWLLRHYNIWLSPIPIALGMLIESFFNSVIGTAVNEGYEQRQALIRRLQASGPDSYATRLALEAEQHPHPAHSLQERAKRFVYLDCLRLWRLGKYGAAFLLFVRRLMFLLVLLLAFYWDSIVPPVMHFLLKT